MEYETQESLEEYKKELRKQGYINSNVICAAVSSQPERLNPETPKGDAIV